MDEKGSSPVAVTEGTFDAAVMQSQKLVLVDFSAAWCGPCRAIAPIMETLAADYADRLTVATVDVDANPRLADRYRIRSVPTVMLVADGEIQQVLVGARSLPEYRKGIEALLH